MKKAIIILIILIIFAVALVFVWENRFIEEPKDVSSFEECIRLGYPVLESYPRQCKAQNGTFSEDIGNILEKQDLIVINQPRPNDFIQSPLVIKGEARGYWYFEASFPVKIIDAEGKELGQGIAQAKADWMTEDFVPFEVRLEFQSSKTEKGILILKKDNPSGLAEYDDELKIPVYFQN